MDIVNLGFAVDASQLMQAKSGLDALSGSSTRAAREMGRSQSQIASGISRVKIAVASLAGLGTGMAVTRYFGSADEWSDLSARVGLAVGEMDRAPEIMRRLAEMADRSYSSIQLTAEGWLQNATALKELGLSVDETLDFVEAFNNAMVVSGAKGDRAAQVMNALNKAMALGKLSGDNLNTVLANGGRAAELLAEELGTTVTGLREAGAAGLITGDVIDRAMRGNLEKLRAEAEEMPATVEDGFLRIRNAAFQMVGTFDQATGISASLADALVRLSETMASVVAGTDAQGDFAQQWSTSLFRLRTALSGLAGGDTDAARTALMHFIEDAQEGANRLAGSAPQVEVSITRLRGALDSIAQGDWATAGGNIRDFVTDAVDGVDRLIDLAFGAGSAQSARAWVDGIVAAIGRLPAEIPAKVGAMAAALAAGMANIASQSLGWAADIVRNIATGLAGLYEAGKAAIADLARGLRESVSGLIADAKQWGADIAAGITGGLAGAKDKVMNAGRGLAGWVKGAFTSETEIQSPSRVFMRFGQFIAEGLGLGITGGTARAVDAVRGMASETIGAADQFRSGIQDAFRSVIDGTKSVPEAIRDMLANILNQLASSGLDRALNSLFGAFTGFGGDPLRAALGAAGAPIPSFAGGGYTGNRPRSGGLDGRGGFMAMMHPRETVVDHTRGQAAAAMTYSPVFNIGGSVTPDDLEAVRREAAIGFAQMRQALPDSIRQYQNNPRMRPR